MYYMLSGHRGNMILAPLLYADINFAPFYELSFFVGGTAVPKGREAGGAGEGRGRSLAGQEEGQGGRVQGILC